MKNKTPKRINKIKTILFLVCCLLNQMAAPTLATEKGFNTVDSEIDIVLKGQGMKKVMFQRVFSVELYCQTNIDPTSILNDVSKALQISTYRLIPKEKLRSLVNNWLNHNLDPATYTSVRREIEQLNHLLIDLNKGDSFTLAYFPDQGTHFYLNDQLRGIIEGQRFAKILFSIWLGDRSVDTNMKANLLAFNK